MSEPIVAHSMGTDVVRRDAWAKVTGTAPYAVEHPVERIAYLYPVRASVPRAQHIELDTTRAEQLDGVLAVLSHRNAPRLADTSDAELAVMQAPEVGFFGQFVAAVVAERPEIARHAASLVRVDYAQVPHECRLDPDSDELYTPEKVNPSFPADTLDGDPVAAFDDAPMRVRETYRTAMYHNNPMEPHASIAHWGDDGFTIHDSTQGVHVVRGVLARVFGLDVERVRVICPYVGGGFGSKGTVHAHAVLAALAALALPGRSVRVMLTRQQMFALAGYRTPTIQRVGLAAEKSGRLSAVTMDVVEQTSRIKEFAEQSGVPARMMYAAPARRTTHRLAALDVPVPSWMRAPGECPGMFGPEVAMDELAVACGIDPIELRLRNEPEVDPETGLPYSSRNLVGCLREGARRFGWQQRDPRPGRLVDGWFVGTGVAASTYPVNQMPGATAAIRYAAETYTVSIGAADLGTGAWTILGQIAADALRVPADRVRMRIGDTALPYASVAGGSSGTTCWGGAIVAAAADFRDRHGDRPVDGATAEATLPDNPARERYAMHAFGAQFAEVRVRADSGEIRVPRLLGVFACGRIINPRTARGQFVGGMTMGLSMALHEDSVLDPRSGQVINHDLAQYHVASCADAPSVQAYWLDEHDPYVNPMGSRGIGEIGIVGTAAAIVNAAYHATGIRVRELPLTCDQLCPAAAAAPPR